MFAATALPTLQYTPTVVAAMSRPGLHRKARLLAGAIEAIAPQFGLSGDRLVERGRDSDVDGMRRAFMAAAQQVGFPIGAVAVAFGNRTKSTVSKLVAPHDEFLVLYSDYAERYYAVYDALAEYVAHTYSA